nr:phosphoribosylaminoimidazolesuccinocarboxamide synthase [Naumannella cuiyingiana]
MPLVHAGKIRELYALPDPDTLLMVATDRISAFDHVLRPGVPDKGAILTQLSQWWFDRLADLVPNHVVSTEVPGAVAGRAVICERLEMIGVECVARGYLTGSGWAEYQRDRTVCGVALPDGLSDGDELPEPIFTPATKAAVGEHDENVDFATVEATIGARRAAAIRDLTMRIYAHARDIAAQRGLVLADTKLEFGVRRDGTIVLADEVLTPDSSRFWDAEAWRASRAEGGVPEAFDKQYVRNWLLTESGWDRAADAPPPPLPDAVVDHTRARYADAYRRLTGEAW